MLNYILTIIFGVLGWSMLIQSHAAWYRTLWKLNSTKGNIYSITLNRKTVENHPARDTNWEGPCHFSWLVSCRLDPIGLTARNPEVAPPSANQHGTTFPKSVIKLCDMGLESCLVMPLHSVKSLFWNSAFYQPAIGTTIHNTWCTVRSVCYTICLAPTSPWHHGCGTTFGNMRHAGSHSVLIPKQYFLNFVGGDAGFRFQIEHAWWICMNNGWIR